MGKKTFHAEGSAPRPERAPSVPRPRAAALAPRRERASVTDTGHLSSAKAGPGAGRRKRACPSACCLGSAEARAPGRRRGGLSWAEGRASGDSGLRRRSSPRPAAQVPSRASRKPRPHQQRPGPAEGGGLAPGAAWAEGQDEPPRWRESSGPGRKAPGAGRPAGSGQRAAARRPRALEQTVRAGGHGQPTRGFRRGHCAALRGPASPTGRSLPELRPPLAFVRPGRRAVTSASERKPGRVRLERPPQLVCSAALEARASSSSSCTWLLWRVERPSQLVCSAALEARAPSPSSCTRLLWRLERPSSPEPRVTFPPAERCCRRPLSRCGGRVSAFGAPRSVSPGSRYHGSAPCG